MYREASALTSRIPWVNNVPFAYAASAFNHRSSLPALFGGDVKEPEYFLVDDFVGQGGTLANLRGFVESQGAKALGATALTGKGYSAKLSLSEDTLRGLKGKQRIVLHGAGTGVAQAVESRS